MALNAKVGSFTKSTGGAPASQAITGLGFQPEALILWTVGGLTSGTFETRYLQSFGLVASTTSRGTMASQSQGGLGTTDTSRRIANLALAIVGSAEATLAECDLTSFDSDGFTLNWTTNDANAYIIHYLALGGADLTNAAVVRWQTPSGTGNQSITGVGFQPDCLIHINNIGSTDPPASFAIAASMLGVMDKDSNEWSINWRGVDGVTTSDTARSWDATRGMATSNAAGSGSAFAAQFVSMDSDGFTVNWTTASGGLETYTLCLKGGQYRAGNLTKPTSGAPVSQSVTGAGFAPLALLFGGSGGTVDFRAAHAVGHIGATDGTTEGASTLSDQDAITIAMNVDAMSKTDKVITTETNFDAAIDAEADLTSLDADGFTLNWTTNDAIARKFGYLAFGSSGAGSQTVSPALIDQSGVVFSPQINLRLALGLIDQSGTTFSPQVNQSVSIGLIDQSAVTFTPQLNLSISLGLIDQSGAVFAFSQITQTVTIGLIDQSGQVFSPSITLSISVGLIDNTATIFTLTQITQTVVIPLISNLGTTFDPTITQPGAALTVSPALIDNTGAPFTLTRIRKSGVSRLCAVPTPSTRLNPVTVPASRDCDVN